MNKQLKLIVSGEEKQEFFCSPGQTVMEILGAQSFHDYDFACGGQGRCGKCKMKVLQGTFEITTQDKAFFSEEQLEQGFRLACTAIVNEDSVVEYLGSREENFEVLSGFKTVQENELSEKNIFSEKSKKSDKTENNSEGKRYGIAIDIGSTTIAVNLMDIEKGESKAVHTTLNRQRRYGADVITRIQASNEGKANELRQSIQEDLLTGIEAVLEKSEISAALIQEISIAGNTTMGHLLLGYSCETLGVYPFTPVDISAKTLSFKDVFGTEKYDIPVYFVPGITAYVGADITAGMLHCGFAQNEMVSMLIDLGTNGEMAIGNKDKILVTSTAAGPAFEGGNISCGTGSVEGAICDVTISEGQTAIKTIADKPMTGICGTGVIAITAELLKEELVEASGLLDEDYFDDGFPLGEKENGEEIVFTQKDVREIQLAKSAVRAGAETLILRYGIPKEQISKVYLAGGFGYKMNLEKAVAIGLLPEELADRVESVGNSSLGGATMALMSQKHKEQLEFIAKKAEEISLSEDKDFQEFYMEYMMFEEE